MRSFHLENKVKGSGAQPHPYNVSLSPGEKYDVPLSQRCYGLAKIWN